MTGDDRSAAVGALCATGAFLTWGLNPIYFKAVSDVAVTEILAHRIAWCFLLLVVLLVGGRRLPRLLADLRPRRTRWLLLASTLLRVEARVEGDAGDLHVLNPFMPQLYHRLRVRTGRGTRVERVHGEATYTHQLRAFAKAVRAGAALATDGRDGVANRRVVDAIYEAAGLPTRGL